MRLCDAAVSAPHHEATVLAYHTHLSLPTAGSRRRVMLTVDKKLYGGGNSGSRRAAEDCRRCSSPDPELLILKNSGSSGSVHSLQELPCIYLKCHSIVPRKVLRTIAIG